MASTKEPNSQINTAAETPTLSEPSENITYSLIDVGLPAAIKVATGSISRKTPARQSPEFWRQYKAAVARFKIKKKGKSSTRVRVELVLTIPAANKSITTSNEHASTADKTGLLDTLPLEIRGMIYENVLAVDDDTYEIEGISSCRRTRYENIYRVTNVERHHLAILAVNKQIRAEVKALIPSKTLRFKNTRAFDYFIFDREDDDEKLKMPELKLLYSAKEVQIVVGKRTSGHVRRRWARIRYSLTELLPQPPSVELVDAEGNDMSAKYVCIIDRYHLERTCTD